MSKYISQYTETTTPEDSDYLLLQRGLTYYKVQKSNLASASDLASVLAVGNNSGVNDIDMKGNQGIRFYNPLDTFYTKILAGAQAGNLTLTLPTTAGSSGQFLQTNGSGTLTWAAALTGTLTSGRVPYASGTSTLTDSANLVWDNANVRLGIGTASPVVSLDVSENSSNYVMASISNANESTASGIQLKGSNNDYVARIYRIGSTSAVHSDYYRNMYFTIAGHGTGTTNASMVFSLLPVAYGQQYSSFRVVSDSVSSNLGYASTKFIATNQGTIGINLGTSFPTANIHVKGSDSTSSNFALKVDNSSSTALFHVNNYGNIGINRSPFSTVALYVKGIGNTSSTYSFATENSASTSTFVVRDDGNVGIGTVTPTNKLTIVGTGTTDTLLRLSATGGTQLSTIIFEGDSGNIFQIGRANVSQTTLSTFYQSKGYFYGANLSASVVSGFYFVTDNTSLTSPTQRTYMNSSGQWNFTQAVAFGESISFSSYSAMVHVKGSDSTSSNFALKVDNSSSSPLLYVRNDGNVGIGTNSPGYKLEVNGSGDTTIKITGGGSNYGALIMQSNGILVHYNSDNRTVLTNISGSGATWISSRGTGGVVLGGSDTGSGEVFIKGGYMSIYNSTPTAVLDLPGAASAAASLRIRSGTAPTSPNDGDIWFDGTDIKMRIGGVTKTFTLV